MTDTGAIVEIISQLGFGGLFLYLFIKSQKEAREDIAKKEAQHALELERKEAQIRAKDELLVKQNEKVIKVLEKNSTVIANNNSTTAANTKSTDILTEAVYRILKPRK